MKKFLITIFCFVLFFPLIACSNQNTEIKSDAKTMEWRVSKEIEIIDGVENVSDEQIKALSVIIRTNLLNNPKEACEEEKTTNLSTEEKERIENLVLYTKGQTLEDIIKTDEKNNEIMTYYIKKDKTYKWKKEIKKYELLAFLDREGVSLANLSDVYAVTDEEGRVTEISIGGKNFSYQKLSKEFGLESDQITNLSSTLSSVIIEGVGNGTAGGFELNSSNSTENNNKNYLEILKEKYPNKQIVCKDISNNC